MKINVKDYRNAEDKAAYLLSLLPQKARAKNEMIELLNDNPDFVTLDRILHTANILHAVGLYEDESKLLKQARKRLDLKDPEYSEKLGYIKNAEKWNEKALRQREQWQIEECLNGRR